MTTTITRSTWPPGARGTRHHRELCVYIIDGSRDLSRGLSSGNCWHSLPCCRWYPICRSSRPSWLTPPSCSLDSRQRRWRLALSLLLIALALALRLASKDTTVNDSSRRSPTGRSRWCTYTIKLFIRWRVTHWSNGREMDWSKPGLRCSAWPGLRHIRPVHFASRLLSPLFLPLSLSNLSIRDGRNGDFPVFTLERRKGRWKGINNSALRDNINFWQWLGTALSPLLM